ncbi:MAG: MopE-related protein [Myxococcota bacterium]|jgi:hypothetical protein|nr:MopE-related protein [Myxococcota bacterium]
MKHTRMLVALVLGTVLLLGPGCQEDRRRGGGGGGGEGEGEGEGAEGEGEGAEGEGAEGEGEGAEGEGEGAEGEGEGAEGEGEGAEGEGEGAEGEGADCGPQAFADCDWTLGVCTSALPRCEPGRGWVCEPLPPAPFERVETLCDGLDNDCDGRIDADLAPPLGARAEAGVCQGAHQTCAGRDGWQEPDYSLIAGYEETERSCDGLDNDCDGQTDEGLDTPNGVCPMAGVCSRGRPFCAGADGWQCELPASYEQVERTCDGEDNDCDGGIDEAASVQPTPADACLSRGVCAGTEPVCRSGDWTCSYGASYEVTESRCDGQDNDCDGQVDEGLSTDADGDGHYAPGSCRQPADDCDDGHRTVHPGAEELLDGLDNDCDELVDCDDDTPLVGCPGCIEPGTPAWDLSGEAYCHAAHLHCIGVAWHGSAGCTEAAPYEGCWGSNALYCCSTPMQYKVADSGSAEWTCAADCPAGSEVGANGQCQDVDECTRGRDDCADEAICTNTVGGYLCTCRAGLSGDGTICTPSPAWPTCILPTEEYWNERGDDYCARFGLVCRGMTFYGTDSSCSQFPYTECWGNDPATCCSRSMSYNVSNRRGYSAEWSCE